jgi:Kdo2-lipid IVA lauroyltransferase/acyltransferase
MTLVAWIMARTPLAVAAGFSRVAAWLWWLFVPIRKSLAVRNFRSAFPGVPPGAALRQMMVELILGYFELLHEERVPGSVVLSLEGMEPIAERQAAGEGALLYSGHLGSWDLIGALMSRQTRLKASIVVKIPSSKSAAALIERVRTAFGLGLLPNERGTMRRVLERLEKGEIVAFIIDQRFARGVAVPFFGRPAMTSPSIAVAAAKTGCPVHFVEYWREGTARHRAVVSAPLPVTGNEVEDVAAFTAKIEEAVRRRPHNWLWLHNRWKGAPGDDRRPA